MAETVTLTQRGLAHHTRYLDGNETMFGVQGILRYHILGHVPVGILSHVSLVQLGSDVNDQA